MRGPYFFCTLLVALASLVCSGAAGADSWTVFSYPGGNPIAPGYPSEIAFTLHNGMLSLNSSTIATVGGSSSTTWKLLFSGNWAVCGTVDESGSYARDPYATFVASGQGGHIEWAGNTPLGYSAPLMVGASFAGAGASNYTCQWGRPINDVTATLALNRHPTFWGPEYNLYDSVEHTFYASYAQGASPVPEPMGLLTLLTGAVSLGGFAHRTRRRAKR